MSKTKIPFRFQIAILAAVFGMLGAVVWGGIGAWQTGPEATKTPKVVWVLKHQCPGDDCEKKCHEGMKPEHAESDWVVGPCPLAQETATPAPPTPPIATTIPTRTPIPTTIPTRTSTPTEIPPTETRPGPTEVPPPGATEEIPVGVPTEPIFTLPTATATATTGAQYGPGNTCDLCSAEEAKLLAEAGWYNKITEFVDLLIDGWMPNFWHFAFRDEATE